MEITKESRKFGSLRIWSQMNLDWRISNSRVRRHLEYMYIIRITVSIVTWIPAFESLLVWASRIHQNLQSWGIGSISSVFCVVLEIKCNLQTWLSAVSWVQRIPSRGRTQLIHLVPHVRRTDPCIQSSWTQGDHSCPTCTLLQCSRESNNIGCSGGGF
jgi:hypothetical protein